MTNPPAYASTLAIHGLKSELYLGVGEKERSKKQSVFIDVKLYFPQRPAAAHDDHANYICYYDISQKIHALCAAKEYRLIEYLVHEIHRLMRGIVPEEVRIAVKLRKASIQLKYVEEGASYSYTDIPPGAWTAP